MKAGAVLGLVLAWAVIGATVSGCGNHLSPASSQATSEAKSEVASEKPLPPETNPLGDIPDSQVFVTYTSDTGAYSFEAPEGWARTVQGSDVKFVDKFDGVTVQVTSGVAPTVTSVKATQVPALERTGRAVKVVEVSTVKLPGGDAILLQFNANSDPDPVTSKQVRLEEQSYIFYRNGKLATMTLWAPLGADNVDQWNRMSRSFRWH